MTRRQRRDKNNMIPIPEEESETSTLPTQEIDIPWTGFQVRPSGDLGHRSRRVTIADTVNDDYGDLAAEFDVQDDTSLLNMTTIPIFEEEDAEAVDPVYTAYMEETSFRKPRSTRQSVSIC